MSRSAHGLYWRTTSKAETSHGVALLPKMIRAHGLDPVETEEAHPEVMRALRTGCTLCTLGNHCVRSLRQRTAADESRVFCLNAPVLNALADYERIAKPAPFLLLETDRPFVR